MTIHLVLLPSAVCVPSTGGQVLGYAQKMLWNSANSFEVLVRTPGHIEHHHEEEGGTQPEVCAFLATDGRHSNLIHLVVPSIFSDHRVYVVDPHFTCVQNRNIGIIHETHRQDAGNLPKIEGHHVAPLGVPSPERATYTKDDASDFDEAEDNLALQAIASRKDDHIFPEAREEQEASTPNGAANGNEEDA